MTGPESSPGPLQPKAVYDDDVLQLPAVMHACTSEHVAGTPSMAHPQLAENAPHHVCWLFAMSR